MRSAASVVDREEATKPIDAHIKTNTSQRGGGNNARIEEEATATEPFEDLGSEQAAIAARMASERADNTAMNTMYAGTKGES